jgi:outer membrane protein TolC
VARRRAERIATMNALVAAVVGAHLDARAARELGAADDASIRSVSAEVDETRVKVEGGGALRSDLLSLEVRLAEARQGRVRSRVAERLALAALRELLALPPAASIEVVEGGDPAGPLPASAVDGLAEAYRSRGEVRAARRAVERAALGLADARRAYLPRVDLEARVYGDDAGAELDFGTRNWTVGLALSLDVFDGLAREARIRQAHAALDEVAWSDRQALLAVARDVESAYLRLEEARARLAVATQAVGAADETFEIVGTRFRGGAEAVTRYLEAEADRTRARTNRIRARLDADRAAIEVARAIGRLAPGAGGNAAPATATTGGATGPGAAPTGDAGAPAGDGGAGAPTGVDAGAPTAPAAGRAEAAS